MKIERKDNELIIRVPDKVFGKAEIQELLDYLKARTILSRSKATKKDINKLSQEIKESWWSKNKSRFLK